MEADSMSYHAANFGGNAINTTADVVSQTSVTFSLPDHVLLKYCILKMPSTPS
jgi:hypothetical protein